MTREKLIEKFDRRFDLDGFQNLLERTSPQELKDFWFSSISEILSEVVPKERGETGFVNAIFESIGAIKIPVKSDKDIIFNAFVSDLKQNIARLGYELTK